MEVMIQKIMESLGIPQLISPEVEEQIPSSLRLSPETAQAITMWSSGQMQIRIAKMLAKDFGWDEMSQLHLDAFLEFIDDILKNDEIKPFLDLLSQSGGDTRLAGNITVMFDAFMGNTDILVESSPKKTVIRNIDCYTWKTITAMGIEKDYNCAMAGLLGTYRVIEILTPDVELEGEHDGAEINCPGIRFNKCRIIGDDCCEMTYVTKKQEKK